MLLYGFLIGTAIAAAFGLYILSETKKVYRRGETLSMGLSLGWWITDGSWSALVALSAFYNLCPLPIEEDSSKRKAECLVFYPPPTAGMIEMLSPSFSWVSR